MIEPQSVDASGNVYPQVNFKTLNYTALIPILISAVKEQQQQITALQAQVAGGQKMENHNSTNDAKPAAIEVELSKAILAINPSHFPLPAIR